MTTREEQQAIANEAAAQAVRAAFKALGVDITQADEIRHFQANMAWVFRFRRLSEKVGTAVIVTVFTLITGGFLKLAWDAITKKGGVHG